MGLPLPRVRHFCCGCQLYTGALVIGILSTLGVLSSFIHTIFGESAEDDVRDVATFFHNNGSFLEEEPLPSEFSDFINIFRPLFYTYDVVSCVFYVIELVLCCCFVYGVVKRVHSLILPGLVIAFIYFVTDSIYLIAGCFCLMYVSSVGVGLGVLALLLVCMAPPLYFLTVVYSFYMELRSERPYSKEFTEPPNLTV